MTSVFYERQQWPAGLATWPAGQVEHLPPPWRSSSHVDKCPRSHGMNRLKTWPAGIGVGSAGQPLGPFSLGFGPLSPHVKYTPGVMMILTFGQLHFVIP
jgi:hypothetical protein